MRRVLQGVRGYALEHTTWTLHRISPHIDFAAAVREVGAVGIIGHVWSEDAARQAHELGIPVINTSNATEPATGEGRVTTEDRRVGELAADHLIDRGLQHFAFYGTRGKYYSRLRLEGFRSRLASRGADCDVLDNVRHVPGSLECREFEPEVCAWIEHLPRPVGILTCLDYHTIQIVEACRWLGLHVPEDVSVLGVDDDVPVCEMLEAPLSTIALQPERIGRLAAAMLDDLLSGVGDLRVVTVPPLGVVARMSTDGRKHTNPDLAMALAFIEQNVHRPIDVGDIVAHIHVSRRSLEQRFRQELGRSPLAEIQRARVVRARDLLATTDQPIGVIARSCGLPNARSLARLFRAHLGTTPQRFRLATRNERLELLPG